MNQHRKTIFFGDVQEYLSTLAAEHDEDAWLLDQHNMARFLSSTDRDVTVYTSLGDLPKDLSKVFDLLCFADIVQYCPPDSWSDGKTLDVTDPGSSIQGMTETLLMLLPSKVSVRGLDLVQPLYDPIPLVDSRRCQQPQLWIAGCSVSHGVGVDSHQRYGFLLAQELGLQCSFLTKGGSALDWAADQICRSDIRPNDWVVWGLTNWDRLTYVHQNTLLPINILSYSTFPHYNSVVSMDSLLSQQNFYNHYYAIQRTINFCAKVGARLIMVGILQGNYALLRFLKSQKNYLHINYDLVYQESLLSQNFIDLGTDSLHPGPLQHQQYKNQISDFIHYNFST